jgi:hypothetical protein
MADALLQIGFRHSTAAGISICLDDMRVPKVKEEMLTKTREAVREAQTQWADGVITNKERYNKVVDLWQQTSDGMTMGIVVITDMSNACEKAQTNKVTKGASGLGITLAELTSDGKMIAPTVGEYNIVSGNGMPSGKFAGVTFFKNAADSCADSIAENQGSASSGKITVTKYDAATGAEGTFELNFSAGEKVTGSFNVASCAVTMASAEPTCE